MSIDDFFNYIKIIHDVDNEMRYYDGFNFKCIGIKKNEYSIDVIVKKVNNEYTVRLQIFRTNPNTFIGARYINDIEKFVDRFLNKDIEYFIKEVS